MSCGKRRLDQLEGQLTPKQAVLLWMNEAHGFGDLMAYFQFLKSQPDSARPVYRLGEQMNRSVEQALKGRPKPELALRVRQAILDVLFLFHLHQPANAMVLERERYFQTYSMMLTQQLTALAREQMWEDQAMWNRMLVGLRTSYPLDPATAAAVDAALGHHVIPWEEVEESDELHRWITDSFLAQGKTELPNGAYRLQTDYIGSFTPPDPEEVRAQFPD
ncbi:MAG: hypothetical protein ACE5Q6_11445 [Dehalococcoidia bacterium]